MCAACHAAYMREHRKQHKVSAGEIIAALSQLSSSDRSRVRLALSLLDKGAAEESELAEELLWEQIVQVAQDRGIHLPALHRVRLMKSFVQFKQDARVAVGYVEECCQPTDKTMMVHALRLCARALITRMQKFHTDLGLEITAMVVMRQAVNIPAAVEAQWPGGSQQLMFLLRRGDV